MKIILLLLTLVIVFTNVNTSVADVLNFKTVCVGRYDAFEGSKLVFTDENYRLEIEIKNNILKGNPHRNDIEVYRDEWGGISGKFNEYEPSGFSYDNETFELFYLIMTPRSGTKFSSSFNGKCLEVPM